MPERRKLLTGLIPRGSVPEKPTVIHRTYSQRLSARKTYSYTNDSLPPGLFTTRRAHCAMEATSYDPSPPPPFKAATVIVVIIFCHIMCYLGLSVPPSLLSLFCHMMCYLGLSVPPSLLSSATLCFIWVSPYHRHCCHLPHYVLPGSLHTTVIVVICHIMCYLGLCIPPSLLSSATLCVTWVSAYHRPCCHLPHYVLPGSLHTAVIVVICHIMLYLGLCIPPLLFCHIMRCLCLPIQPIVSLHSIACCSGEGGGMQHQITSSSSACSWPSVAVSTGISGLVQSLMFSIHPCPSLSASASSLFGVPCRVVFDRVSCRVIFNRVPTD